MKTRIENHKFSRVKVILGGKNITVVPGETAYVNTEDCFEISVQPMSIEKKEPEQLSFDFKVPTRIVECLYERVLVVDAPCDRK